MIKLKPYFVRADPTLRAMVARYRHDTHTATEAEALRLLLLDALLAWEKANNKKHLVVDDKGNVSVAKDKPSSTVVTRFKK